MPKAYAYFRVSAGNLPIEEITHLLGITPTEAWKKGDSGRYNPSRPDSGWCLHSPLPRSTTDLLEHIEALLPLLEQRAVAVKSLSEKYETYFVCVGEYDETVSPGLFLSREVMASIASLGLAFDADLYFDGGHAAR